MSISGLSPNSMMSLGGTVTLSKGSIIFLTTSSVDNKVPFYYLGRKLTQYYWAMIIFGWYN